MKESFEKISPGAQSAALEQILKWDVCIVEHSGVVVSVLACHPEDPGSNPGGDTKNL